MIGRVLTVWSFMMVMKVSSVYGKESGGRPTRQIPWWESVIHHPTRMKRQMKYSISSWEKSHDC